MVKISEYHFVICDVSLTLTPQYLFTILQAAEYNLNLTTQ